MVQNLGIPHKMPSLVSSPEALGGVGWQRFLGCPARSELCETQTHTCFAKDTPLPARVPVGTGIAAAALPQFLGTPSSPAGAEGLCDGASVPGAGTVPATGSGATTGVAPGLGCGHRALALG